MISYYNTGTATVGAGGTTVTFAAAGLGSVEFPTIQPGDLFTDPAQPEVPPQRIASLDYTDHTAELWEPWPGSAMVAAPYEIRLIGDVVRSTAQTRRYLEMLGQLAALGIQPNAFGEFSDRDAYDDQARGFIFLDIGDPWTLYIKLSSDVGDWDDGQSMEGAPGPAGPPGADSTVPGPPGPANTLSIGTVTDGISADATITGTAPTQTLNLVLPKGDDGTDGTDGDNGWSPALAVITDNARRVLQVADWAGGEGTKPAAGDYIGPTGLTPTLASAVDIRGPQGAPGSGSVDSVNGDPGPDIVLDADDIDDTGTTHKFATAAQLSAIDGIDTKLDKSGGTLTGPLAFTHQTSPTNPASGTLALFAKSDNNLYTRTSSGVEVAVGAGGATGIITPQQYGAVGDGVTNDYTALLAAINAALAGNMVLDGMGKAYAIATPISLSNPGLLRWRNITIQATNFASPNIIASTSVAVAIIGTAPSLVSTLASNATRSAESITLTSAAGLAAEDWIYVYTEKQWARNAASGSNPCTGIELVRVESVVGNVVNLRTPLKAAYATANNASVYKVSTNTRCDWENVWVNGIGPTSPTAGRGVYVLYGFGSRYRDCGMRFCEADGISEVVCAFTDADNWTFIGDGNSEFGGGIATRGCHDCFYGDLQSYRVRHTITFGSAGSGLFVTAPIGRGGGCGDVVARQALGSPIDQHAGHGPIIAGNLTCDYAALANATSPAVIAEGGGIYCGSVTARGLKGNNGISMRSAGWADENVTPTLHVTMLDIETTTGHAIECDNRAQVNGTFAGNPRVACIVDAVSTQSGIGIRGLGTYGDARIAVGPGRMLAKGGGGQGDHGIRLTSTSLGRVYLETLGTDIVCTGTGSARLAWLQGDPWHTANASLGCFMTSRGGSFTPSGTVNSFLTDDSSIYLDGVVEAATTTRTGVGTLVRDPIPIFGSATYNPPSLADAAGTTTTVTVTGAALGDRVDVTFSLDLQGITVTGWISAANTVSVRFQNESGGTLDLASGTLTATVRRSSL